VTADRRSPLAHRADVLAAAGGEDVTLTELPFLAQVNVRTSADGMPGPNTVAVAGERRTLWLGPDEWLVVSEPGSEAAIEAELRAAGAASVVDVSANRTTLVLAGPRARDVLMKGCALDLHPRAFGPGRCAQTQIARTQVILEQTGDEPAYRLYVRPSFAAHLAAWLVDAMEEFGAASRSSISRRQRSVRSTSLNV
jgi:sarcosine oxidase, subunit gamma